MNDEMSKEFVNITLFLVRTRVISMIFMTTVWTVLDFLIPWPVATVVLVLWFFPLSLYMVWSIPLKVKLVLIQILPNQWPLSARHSIASPLSLVFGIGVWVFTVPIARSLELTVLETIFRR